MLFLLCCTGEALHHVEKYLLEHPTDGTDAFYTLYRLREVPTARFIPNCNWWGEIIRAFFVN